MCDRGVSHPPPRYAILVKTSDYVRERDAAHAQWNAVPKISAYQRYARELLALIWFVAN